MTTLNKTIQTLQEKNKIPLRKTLSESCVTKTNEKMEVPDAWYDNYLEYVVKYQNLSEEGIPRFPIVNLWK